MIFRQMSKDLVDTKSTLEKEHKLVLLQMQAINELWKKVFFIYTKICNKLLDNLNISMEKTFVHQIAILILSV